jgi:hypothetical protein
MTPAHPTTIALAIPHTPWIPERVESRNHLLDALGIDTMGYDPGTRAEMPAFAFSMFCDREANKVWSQRMFRWAIATGATHLLQLQDDALVAPRFWPILRAMIEAQPNRIIGLEATHPLTPVQHRAGRRWYRDHWLIGVGYVIPCWQLERTRTASTSGTRSRRLSITTLACRRPTGTTGTMNIRCTAARSSRGASATYSARPRSRTRRTGA